MLPYEVERRPRVFDALRERATVGVVVTPVEVVFKQGRRQARPQARMLPLVVIGDALLYVADVVVGESHHALGVFAEVLGGEVTRQGGLQGDVERHCTALGPGLLQLLAAVVQAHIFAVFDGVVDGVVPVVVALGGLLLKGGEVDRLHLQHGLHLMPYGEEGDAYHHQCRSAHGDAPVPTLLPTQEGIDGRDNGDSSQDDIA